MPTFGHQTLVQEVSRASRIIYFVHAEITKKRIITVCANIRLAREIIVHMRSSVIKVDIISLENTDTLVMQFMLIVYFSFLD